MYKQEYKKDDLLWGRFQIWNRCHITIIIATDKIICWDIKLKPFIISVLLAALICIDLYYRIEICWHFLHCKNIVYPLHKKQNKNKKKNVSLFEA